MASLITSLRKFLSPPRPLPAGNYAYRAGADDPFPYRLHLRIESGGQGLLIVNAATVLHLNQTAAEYAYYLIQGKNAEQVGKLMASRYRVEPKQASQDFNDFVERLHTLIDTPDLDPETYLGFDRSAVYEHAISAPYRLDCALTYRLPSGTAPSSAPIERVKRELSAAEWKIIIDKAWQVGIPHLVFTGGEPTLRDDLAEILTYCEDNGQVSGLLTDGLRLADRDYFESLARTGLDHLMIVLDPQQERAWQALEVVLADDLFSAVHLTITPQNRQEIPALMRRLAEMKANAISLSAVESSLAADLNQARQLAAELGLPLVWDLPTPYSALNPLALELQAFEELPQGAGHAWLYVEPDGDVLPAQGMPQVLGNILNDPWEKIWREEYSPQSAS